MTSLIEKKRKRKEMEKKNWPKMGDEIVERATIALKDGASLSFDGIPIDIPDLDGVNLPYKYIDSTKEALRRWGRDAARCFHMSHDDVHAHGPGETGRSRWWALCFAVEYGKVLKENKVPEKEIAEFIMTVEKYIEKYTKKVTQKDDEETH